MKTLGAGLLVALMMTGCGDDDGPVGTVDAMVDATVTMPDAQPPDATLGSVTISATERRRTMTGLIEQTYGNADIQVEGSDGAGGTITRQGALVNGAGTITGVPEGDLVYSYKSMLVGGTTQVTSAYFTRERTLDLGSDTTGGYGSGFPNSGTNLVFNLSGLTPWTAAHTLRMLVPTHASTTTALSATAPAGITGFPVNGATSLNALTFPWGRQFPDPTDQILLVQRETVAQGVLSVTRIIKSFTLPQPTTLADGAPTQFTGALTDAPTITVPVHVDGTAWSAHISKIAPLAGNSTLYLRYFGGPPPLDRAIELGGASMVGTTPAANLDLTLGDPFTGKRVLSVLKMAMATVHAPGATGTVVVPYTSLVGIYDLDALPAGGPTPVLTPVEKPMIAGRDARQPQTGVGVTPTLSWSAPAIGTPTHHEVLIEELVNMGGSSRQRMVARLHTGENSLRVPAGILEAGKSYTFAVLSDTYRMPNAVNRTFTRLPAGSAVSLSAPFIP